MTEWQLKDVSENSWILSKDGSKTALVIATADGLKVIGPFDKKLFSSADDLGTYLGGNITFESRDADNDTDDEVGEINGYPIKHKIAFDVIEEEYVTYTKIAKSKSRYAAGYFAIEFDNGWTASYCPRLQTLSSNNFIGPFRSKLEMLNAMSQKKRTSRL